jgi:phosphoglycolate phosphatase-like HAD superfamily hydrolase
VIDMNLSRYATLIFDCDGVILDSNKVKTAAFFTAALPYGARAAKALVEHHTAHGGISRYRKFEYFLQHLVGVPVEQSRLDRLLETFAREVRDGLLTCQVDPGLGPLRAATAPARWMVVSGGDQDELRNIFRLRHLTQNFNGGIFGSPDSKEVILARELANSSIQLPGLFVGDSQYDHEVASRAGLDFVFASHWTEFVDWNSYQKTNAFAVVPDLGGLLDTHT